MIYITYTHNYIYVYILQEYTCNVPLEISLFDIGCASQPFFTQRLKQDIPYRCRQDNVTMIDKWWACEPL